MYQYMLWPKYFLFASGQYYTYMYRNALVVILNVQALYGNRGPPNITKPDSSEIMGIAIKYDICFKYFNL